MQAGLCKHCLFAADANCSLAIDRFSRSTCVEDKAMSASGITNIVPWGLLMDEDDLSVASTISIADEENGEDLQITLAEHVAKKRLYTSSSLEYGRKAGCTFRAPLSTECGRPRTLVDSTRRLGERK